jgi:hypothetical protein
MGAKYTISFLDANNPKPHTKAASNPRYTNIGVLPPANGFNTEVQKDVEVPISPGRPIKALLVAPGTLVKLVVKFAVAV